MTIPDPVFVGFFPKHTARPGEWFGETHVEEICSVSECISRRPEGWIEHWKHNEPWGFFDTEALAREVTGGEACDLYAYRLFPLKFEGGLETLIKIDVVIAGDALSCYELLGYDIVSRSSEYGFECSPLSCNGGWKEYPVNRHCLIDDLELAWRAACEIARDSAEKGGWEPGPYHVLEVWRRTR